MKPIGRSYIVAAIAVAAIAIVWHFWLGPRWTIRVPRNTVIATKYVGTLTNADPRTGVIPQQDALAIYDRDIRVIDAADWPRSVVLQDKYTARNTQTGAVLFEHITNGRVDAHTGALAGGPHKGNIVLFPRNVEKRAYTMRSNYIPSLPLEFSGARDVGGLETYLFSYVGPIEYATVFSSTTESPRVKILAGQEIRCLDDQFYYRVWIEPRTGAQVEVEEGCLSGDFLYDKDTGKKIAALDRWNGVTTGGDLAARITEVYRARRAYLAALYLPGILLIGSAGILAIGFYRKNTRALA